MGAAGVGAEARGDVGAAGAPQERHREIAAGRQGLGRGTGADGGAVLVEGDVADVMEPILDLPMAALVAEQGGGIGAVGGEAGDEVGDLDGGRATRGAAPDRGAVALDAAELADVRPGGAVGAGGADPSSAVRSGRRRR